MNEPIPYEKNKEIKQKLSALLESSHLISLNKVIDFPRSIN